MQQLEIVEVGLRDGLQDQPKVVSVTDRLTVLDLLVKAGLRSLELGSFVRPDRVPQMAASGELFEAVANLYPGVDLMALVPNLTGARKALSAGTRSIKFVLSASEGHSRSNTGRSVSEGITEARLVAEFALKKGLNASAAIATAFVCPFDGVVATPTVVGVARTLVGFGYQSVSVADTLGRANPRQVRETVTQVMDAIGGVKVNLHLHDTYGMGLANVLAGLEAGVRSFDVSIAGIGGCPFAPGAAGNVATEDLIFMTHELGYQTGIDLDLLGKAVSAICSVAECEPTSALAQVRGWSPNREVTPCSTTAGGSA